jgi:hypothetical protein
LWHHAAEEIDQDTRDGGSQAQAHAETQLKRFSDKFEPKISGPPSGDAQSVAEAAADCK